MVTLDGETVLVTGASRGLGASMAKRFAAEGANVVLTARSEGRLESVAAEIDASDAGDALVVPADVTDGEAVRNVVETAVDAYGRIDALVNNAAIGQLTLHDELRDLADVEEDDWRKILDVNLTGVFLCCKYAVPHMVEAGRGNVINVSSGLGRRAAAGWSPYVASKWGLEGLNKTLAYELEDAGVNVNAIDPGGRAETGFWDHLPEDEREEILDPDVMDEAAVLLAAQEPGAVTAESMTAQEWEDRLSG